MSISDNRLAEIAAFQPLDWGVTHMELVEMATELQSLRAAAKVRAIREGDGEWVMVPKAAIDWLDGAAPDADGKWFGDDVPEGKP